MMMNTMFRFSYEQYCYLEHISITASKTISLQNYFKSHYRNITLECFEIYVCIK
jgi:hypothetical protein